MIKLIRLTIYNHKYSSELHAKSDERFMQNQMYPYLNQMAMIEKWRKTLEIGGHAGTPITDLSQAFECIDHELLIAKLHSHGFDTDAPKFINSYLKGRKQSTKINSSYSSFA